MAQNQQPHYPQHRICKICILSIWKWKRGARLCICTHPVHNNMQGIPMTTEISAFWIIWTDFGFLFDLTEAKYGLTAVKSFSNWFFAKFRFHSYSMMTYFINLRNMSETSPLWRLTQIEKWKWLGILCQGSKRRPDQDPILYK